jgi:hypothetical protein
LAQKAPIPSRSNGQLALLTTQSLLCYVNRNKLQKTACGTGKVIAQKPAKNEKQNPVEILFGNYFVVRGPEFSSR